MGEELITPTKIYVKTVLSLIDKYNIKAISHITGGGFIENIPRMLPEGLKASVKKGSWKILPIFEYLQKLGNIPEADMYNTFNMGIGMVMAVPAEEAQAVAEEIEKSGEKAYILGEIVPGNGIEIV